MNVIYFSLALLARLPMRWLRGVGWLLGTAAYYGNRKRRHVTRTNLRIAFPALTDTAREDLVKLHLQTLGMALLDRVWLWFAPLNVVYARITLTGFEHLPSTVGAETKPAILLIPHFAGLEAAGPAWVSACLQRGIPTPTFTTIFQPQGSNWEDTLFRRGRGRFADLTQFTRQDGIRPVIKAMRPKDGQPGRNYYCLPDNDFGAKDAVFVPFFGVPAATITVLPKLSAMMQAPVIPLITRMTSTGYSVEAMPAMAGMGQDTSTAGLIADCTAMSIAIEGWVRTMPDQYLFSHRRYKTRRLGEPSVY